MTVVSMYTLAFTVLMITDLCHNIRYQNRVLPC